MMKDQRNISLFHFWFIFITIKIIPDKRQHIIWIALYSIIYRYFPQEPPSPLPYNANSSSTMGQTEQSWHSMRLCSSANTRCHETPRECTISSFLQLVKAQTLSSISTDRLKVCFFATIYRYSMCIVYC